METVGKHIECTSNYCHNGQCGCDDNSIRDHVGSGEDVCHKSMYTFWTL